MCDIILNNIELKTSFRNSNELNISSNVNAIFEYLVNILNLDNYPPHAMTTWTDGGKTNNKFGNQKKWRPEDQHLV